MKKGADLWGASLRMGNTTADQRPENPENK